MYATNITGQWNTEEIDASGDVGSFPSLVVRPDQTVAIAYFDASNADLKYAENSSGAWVLTTLDSNGSSGQYPSMQIGPDGLMNIAYYYSTGSQVKYIKQTAAGWTSPETVDGYLQQTGNYGLSLDIDRLGRTHISYYNATDKNLYYAYRDAPENVWQITAVDTDANNVGKFSSIVVQ